MREAQRRTTGYQSRGHKHGRRSTKIGKISAVLMLVAVLAVIFYCAGGLGVYHGSASHQSEIAGSAERLKALESRELPEITGKRTTRNVQVDLAELQARLLENYGDYYYNADHFRKWFEDAAIVGDSVAEAIRGFEWVNDSNIQSEIGISLYSCENVIEGTERLMPSTIFLTFSANDIKSYTEYINTFISDYSDVIRRLQTNVPGAEIYVQGILPCDAQFLEEYWYYSYLDEYNTRIEAMCEELGVHYYNMGFIFDAHPDIFSEDGLHPTWPFYPLWLTYMAEIAGLTGEEG